jgi:SAM-dependent methyltransferase
MRSLYDDRFFDWVDSGARRSAQAMLPEILGLLPIRSVVDVGCGRGTWLEIWRNLGVDDVMGIDGSHVSKERLAIPPERFIEVDLTSAWTGPTRRFDLAQSLEVGEHLPAASAQQLVDGLCALSDVVLFSAATPGQGGEWHINEQEPTYWAGLFAQRGFSMYDCIGPLIAKKTAIEPWYRYNAFLYANDSGTLRLPASARSTLVAPETAPARRGDLAWRLRRMALRPLMPSTVTKLSRAKYLATTKLRGMRST